MTLLEPLAAALGLGVEELMACRRQAVYDGEEDPMKNLLTISSDSLRRERRRSWGRMGAVLALVLAAALVIGYNALYVTETREDTFVLKETVDGADYLYMRQEGDLLKLRCGGDVDYDAIALEYNAVVLTDCCSSQTEEIQRVNLEDMGRAGAMLMDSAAFTSFAVYFSQS